MFVTYHISARCHDPDHHPNLHCHKNLKSRMYRIVSQTVCREIWNSDEFWYTLSIKSGCGNDSESFFSHILSSHQLVLLLLFQIFDTSVFFSYFFCITRMLRFFRVTCNRIFLRRVVSPSPKIQAGRTTLFRLALSE